MSELPSFLMTFDVYTYVVIPILIILARIGDVSIGTVRTVFITKGYRKVSMVFGFFEVLIWLFVGRQVLVKSESLIHLIAYAGGFGLGNYIGLMIEDKMSLGFVSIRVILRRGSLELLHFLEERDIGYTVLDGQGAQESVKVIFSVLKRQDLPEVVQAIHRHHPNAFYVIEDVRSTSSGVFPRQSKKRFLHFGNGRK